MAGKDLKDTERRSFRAAVDTGLWDLFLASVVAMFAIAPLLSGRLGDFGSAAVFLPVWLVVYLLLRVVRDRFVMPRVGTVRFGHERIQRMRTFLIILAGANGVAFLLGALLALRPDARQLALYPIVFGLMMLALSSLAAYAWEIPRIFGYGLLIALAPLVGEWPWRGGYAAHHGYPAVFGVVTVVILATGLSKLLRLPQPPAAPQ